MNELVKGYFLYMIEKLLPCIESSAAKGIEEYCMSQHSSIKTTSADSESHNFSCVNPSIDQQQPDFFEVFGDDLNNDPYYTRLCIPKKNIISDVQSSTFNSTIDEYQAENTGVPDQQQYLYSNVASASMSAGIGYFDNTNDFISGQNQLGFQNSESGINTPDVIVLPTLFVSSLNEDELNHHNYKPSSNG